MDSKKEKLTEIEGLFQFVVMLQIFFISIIDLLFRLTGNTVEQIVRPELQYGVMIAVFISAYLLIKIWGKHFSEWVLRLSKSLLLLEILSFVPIIILIGNLFNKQIGSEFFMMIFKLSMWILVFLPILIFILLFINTIYYWYKEPTEAVIKFIKGKIKKI